MIIHGTAEKLILTINYDILTLNTDILTIISGLSTGNQYIIKNFYFFSVIYKNS
jgi:hypothetical protein